MLSAIIGCKPHTIVVSNDKNLVGGPMAVKEARRVATKASGRLPERFEKFKGEFEKNIIDLLAHRDPIVRTSAAEKLGSFRRPEGADALLLACEDNNAQVRASAIEAAGWTRSTGISATLAHYLNDENISVREQTARALGRLLDLKASAAALTSTLQSDSEPSVRLAAVRSLGALRATGSSEIISRVLKQDPSSQVRAASAGALGLIKGDQATAPLIVALGDASPMVRYMSIMALGSIGDPSVADDIEKLQKDTDSTVRKAVAEVLRKLKTDP